MANFDQKSLKALKKQLAEKTKVEKTIKQESVKKQRQQQEDENVFHNAMTDVNPLDFSNAVHEAKKPKARRLQHSDVEDEFIINDPLSDELEVTEIDGGEILSFCRD